MLLALGPELSCGESVLFVHYVHFLHPEWRNSGARSLSAANGVSVAELMLLTWRLVLPE